ncbi:unnamed protein product [Rotaria sp. Silwood1]|nr:unnamed protein product [Rotaria sp. Silwood1]
MTSGELALPLTVYRGQTKMANDELKKIEENIDGLISMHTFLSTTVHYNVAYDYVFGADPDTTVIFQITVKDTEQGKRMNTFARISQKSSFKDEEEVLFGVSSVFRIISVQQEYCFWFIELESTTFKEDETVQRFMSEIQTYLYQSSGKQVPFFVFKQLFTIDSINYARPFIELTRFILVETIQSFLAQAYKKEGRMRELIENVPDLHALITMSNAEIVRPKSRIICLLFDMLHDFLYPKNNKDQEVILFDNNNGASLLCFGGFLLLTGDLMKGCRYFKILLENESIDDTMKLFIHRILEASDVVIKDKELVWNSDKMAMKVLETSAAQLMPGWFPNLIASTHVTIDDPNKEIENRVSKSDLLINQESLDNTVDEKLRLIYLGHTYFQKDNFLEALNYWEEAAEIESHMPASAETIYNGSVYIQMAAAYFRLNNKIDALNTMEKAIEYLKSYYPPTHRMFATLNFLHGYYLMYNEKLSEAIKSFNKSLENPHFSNNEDFCALVYTLLVSASMQYGDLDSAEYYCLRAVAYKSTNIGAQAIHILRQIPELKMVAQYNGPDFIREMISGNLQSVQQLISQIHPHSSTISGLNNEETWTFEKFITVADHYRHRKDNEHAELYYSKALDKMTEAESKSMWNVYRKMVRMGSNSDQYQDYFIKQFSKYDDNNPNHFSMIATLQTILYKLSLFQNEYTVAFDCLISSVLMAVKSLFYQSKADSKCISKLLDGFLHHDLIAKVAIFLTKLMDFYSIDLIAHLQPILSKYIVIDDLASIIHHTAVDCFFDRMKSKCENDPLAETIFRFLHTILKCLRQSISSTEESILPFGDQVLKFLRNYKDEKSPWFSLMNALESLCIGDNENFFINVDHFRLQTATFERYQQLKENLSIIFAKFDETKLYSYLKRIDKIL